MGSPADSPSPSRAATLVRVTPSGTGRCVRFPQEMFSSVLWASGVVPSPAPTVACSGSAGSVSSGRSSGRRCLSSAGTCGRHSFPVRHPERQTFHASARQSFLTCGGTARPHPDPTLLRGPPVARSHRAGHSLPFGHFHITRKSD